MMFSPNQGSNDEYSTDNDGDQDYYDEEEDDDDYLGEDDDDDYPILNGAHDGSWEPQVKRYSNMNLKDQVTQSREQMELEQLSKQLQQAKKRSEKRAEKRKRQKEKKSKARNITPQSSPSNNNKGDTTIDEVDFETVTTDTLER
jgi:hypothetical protein